MDIAGLHIHVTGIVQGVGFRPFVYGLAKRLLLTGWVRNTSAGVDIDVDGAQKSLDEFTALLQSQLPPLARVDELVIETRSPNGYQDFVIVDSEARPDAFQPISPDVSICPDCLRELFDPDDRRYRYPFINCTNCGPRFTIIQDIPYDRPNTTMVSFPMCPSCAEEYANPLDRRFHAQPVACPVCGPHVWLEGAVGDDQTAQPDSGILQGDAALIHARELLRKGKIVAIKGLGGFHLACDALNPSAVEELRRRKLRVDKPFALMMPDMETIQEHCLVDEGERLVLEYRARPVVILNKRKGSPIAAQTAPHQDTLGVMLPYTPLHYLLFSADPQNDSAAEDQNPIRVLVMTSGNLSEEPIATDNDEARIRLASLADAFLMHDRPIRTRCDDSVVRVFPVPGADQIQPRTGHHPDADRKLHSLLTIRRSRGYAPDSVRLPWSSPPIFASGAELKNTFCLARDRYAFLSQHIGDLENYETLQSFEDSAAHFERLFRITPEALVYDLHPNYLATRYALERAERESLQAIGIQHHHAHIASCMVENGLDQDVSVIGVAFDGTGYGTDGAVWGGEFLIAGYRQFRRAAHLKYMPLLGGDAGTRKPARIALGYLWKENITWDPSLEPVSYFCAEERTALRSLLEHGINTPQTSSMGRLFDAVAALTGIREQVNYEAQAAIELEACVDQQERGAYQFDLLPRGVTQPQSLSEPMQISSASMLNSVAAEILEGVPRNLIAARFHNGVAQMVYDVCQQLRSATGIQDVVLSGGVWQNATLLAKTCQLLLPGGFLLHLHHSIPPNDGGISLGQAAIASQILTN